MGMQQSGPGFTGHVEDDELGLIYMQARYFNPGTGRFLSVDPQPFYATDESFNRFTYVSNNPMTMVDPDGQAGKVAWLVKLTSNGMRRIARLSEEQAVAARRVEKNVLADRQSLSASIERKAFPEEDQLRHKGHDLGDGATGKPHYQTEGKRGHTFWGIIATVTSAAAASLDNVAKAAEYLPDPTPRLANADDIDRTNNIIDMVNSAIGTTLPPMSKDNIFPEQCDASCWEKRLPPADGMK